MKRKLGKQTILFLIWVKNKKREIKTAEHQGFAYKSSFPIPPDWGNLYASHCSDMTVVILVYDIQIALSVLCHCYKRGFLII